MSLLRGLIGVAILGLVIWVCLSPQLVYAPVPRTVLFAAVGMLLAVLFAAEAASKFEMRLPGFLMTTGGGAAVCFGALVLLTYLAKPQIQVTVFSVVDAQGQAVDLNWDGAIQLPTMPIGVSATWFVKGNTLLLIFPEQLGEQSLIVKETSAGPDYAGTVSYAGSGPFRLELGKELKHGGASR